MTDIKYFRRCESVATEILTFIRDLSPVSSEYDLYNEILIDLYRGKTSSYIRQLMSIAEDTDDASVKSSAEKLISCIEALL